MNPDAEASRVVTLAAALVSPGVLVVQEPAVHVTNAPSIGAVSARGLVPVLPDKGISEA